MPATAKQAMKDGPPRSPKLRKQIVSAPHNATPRMYTLHSGVSFTILECGVGILAASRCVKDRLRPETALMDGGDSVADCTWKAGQLHFFC